MLKKYQVAYIAIHKTYRYTSAQIDVRTAVLDPVGAASPLQVYLKSTKLYCIWDMLSLLHKI